MQLTQLIIILAIFGVLLWVVQHLGEIRQALNKADPRLGGKVACYYCGNYFLITEVEVYGAYTYCRQHGKARQLTANKRG